MSRLLFPSVLRPRLQAAPRGDSDEGISGHVAIFGRFGQDGRVLVRKIALSGSIERARIEVPRIMQAMSFHSVVRSSTVRVVPVRNAGSVRTVVAISVKDESCSFSAAPSSLVLAPGEVGDVQVTFSALCSV